MFKIPKIFQGKRKASQPSKDIIETTILEQNSETSLDNQLAIKEGQVTIQCTGVSPENGSLLVGFFVYNGHNHKVKFEKVPLVLMDSNRRVLARQSFDSEIIGEIAGGSERACVVRFLPDNVYVKDVPGECRVCFDVHPKHLQNNRIQYQALPENTTEDQRRELERVLAELPPMNMGAVDFSPHNAQITPQSDLLTTVIIRNSTDKDIDFKKISLISYDSCKKELARGLFDVEGLTIHPSKALLWTFNFGPVEDSEIDLSGWYLDVEL